MGLVSEFLAGQFAKFVPHDAPDYHHIISAIFSEIAIKRGVGGIY